MADTIQEPYFWDVIRPELLLLALEPWGKRVVPRNARQSLSTTFALRAMRRVEVVDMLFRGGYYWESHPVVRSGYEDWVQLAFVLRKSGEARCKAFSENVHKQDAGLYEAFVSLCGRDAAKSTFGEPPPVVKAFLGQKRSQPQHFQTMAEDVGLRSVHDFVYPYLSGRSHPTGRSEGLFDQSPTLAVAQIPKRDKEEEIQLAVWVSWFTARVLILGSREFGFDREAFCDENRMPIADGGANLETCALVRESRDQLTGEKQAEGRDGS